MWVNTYFSQYFMILVQWFDDRDIQSTHTCARAAKLHLTLITKSKGLTKSGTNGADANKGLIPAHMIQPAAPSASLLNKFLANRRRRPEFIYSKCTRKKNTKKKKNTLPHREFGAAKSGGREGSVNLRLKCHKPENTARCPQLPAVGENRSPPSNIYIKNK